MFQKLEEKFGLPPLGEGLKMLSGPGGKQLRAILDKLMKLAENEDAVKDALRLLEVVKGLDDSGGLERLDSVLKQIGPLTRGKNFQTLMEKFDKIEGMVEVFLKE